MSGPLHKGSFGGVPHLVMREQNPRSVWQMNVEIFIDLVGIQVVHKVYNPMRSSSRWRKLTSTNADADCDATSTVSHGEAITSPRAGRCRRPPSFPTDAPGCLPGAAD